MVVLEDNSILSKQHVVLLTFACLTAVYFCVCVLTIKCCFLPSTLVLYLDGHLFYSRKGEGIPEYLLNPTMPLQTALTSFTKHSTLHGPSKMIACLPCIHLIVLCHSSGIT